MIFFSYAHFDKSIVDTIAKDIAMVFGQENIFYDKWSIQPGDGIIEKVNGGLEKCKFFFFFMSKNSLNSNMVKTEWQNALCKKTKNNEIKFIPVKLDDCNLPDILLQTMYIDISNHGLDFGITNIIEVINGTNISKIEHAFSNIKSYIKIQNNTCMIEFRAEYYTEPQSCFLVLVNNLKDDLEYKVIGEGMFYANFCEKIKLDNGTISNAIYFRRDRPTSVGFPFIAEISTKNNMKLDILGTMRAISNDKYVGIPIINN